MDGSPVTACRGTFYDSGGSTGNYGNNQTLTTVICPGNGGGSHVRLSFSGIDLATGDALCFYDGPDVTAPLLACAAEYPPGQPFIVQATAANASGCLTVVFTSNASGTATGWAAAIACTASCQTIEANILSTQPAVLPSDTGWIDICPGQTIAFVGKGNYPQNGYNYTQSDATSIFEWQFGDGDVSNDPVGAHRYDRPGGYIAQLFVTDAKGCRSTRFSARRIRVAPRPVFLQTLPPPSPVCAGDTLQLSAVTGSVHPRKNLSVTPTIAAFSPIQSRSDSLSLPDGIGTAYQTGIFLTSFGHSQVLTNANELEQICVNMEHSWARDLEIKIICPNGQSAILHNFAGREGNKILLGEPYDNDVVTPVPGKGYDYCWTPTATQAPWLQTAASLSNGGTLPAGNYQSAESLNNLLGCPLNGEWSLRITDQWQSDNGFIFSWGLTFKDNLYRQPEQFTPALQIGYWNQPFPLIHYSTDSIAAKVQNAGLAAFRFTVIDAFGCSWDTTLTTQVLPPTHPDCYTCKANFPSLRDTAVCAKEPVLFDITSQQPDTFPVYFEVFPGIPVGYLNHPPPNPHKSEITIGNLGYNILINPVLQIKNICVDISTDRAGDLNLSLRAPDGKVLALSSNNGGSGPNYTKTCFTPNATAPIAGAAAPLTGAFQPEGNWDDLAGASVNGTWQLLVSDADGPEMGTLNAWSMGFQVVNSVTYTWNSLPMLSCLNCSSPVAVANQTTTYQVRTRDAFGCMTRDSATVRIQTLLDAPANLGVQNFGPDFMTWHWNPVPGAAGYEVRIGGGAWQMPNASALSHTVSGLIPGEVVEIEVRAVSNNAFCTPTTAGASQRLIICTFSATLDSVQAVRCAGSGNGSAFISLQNAQPPALFFPNGTGSGLPSGNLKQLFSSGNHFVVVRDGTGCRDTVTFNIQEPPPVMVMASASAARCHGQKSGSVTAVATGGTGIIQYTWRACTGGPVRTGATASNLLAGCYGVTATDANDCTATNTAVVTEPPALNIQITADSVRCFGGFDGSAAAVVVGGTPGYRYQWDNGTTTANVSGLSPGIHVLRLQDALGCEVVTTVFTGQPAQLLIDSTQAVAPRCFGDSTGRIAVFPSGGTPPYGYQWNNPQTTQTAVQLPEGNYTITITDSRNCRVVTALALVNPPPVSLVFSSVLAEKCVAACDGSAQINTIGGTAPYQLAWGGIVILKGDTLAMQICPGRWPLSVTDKNGCEGQDTLRIEAAVPLVLAFNSTNPTCAGILDGTVSAIVNGGQPPYQYRWNNGSTNSGLTGLPCGEYVVTVTDANRCTQTDTVRLSCLAVLHIAVIVVKPAKCFGQSSGAVTVTPQGGTLPYQYIWSDPNRQVDSSAMNLIAGSYTVTVSDARGCSVTATETVKEPNPVKVRMIPADARCFGSSDGQATAQVEGGRMPYFFEWSNNATDSILNNVRSGNYSLTVRDANGCEAPVITTFIGQPPTPVNATAIQAKKACFGLTDGKAVAQGAGGVGRPYTFEWSNGAADSLLTGITGGVFTVTVGDRNGCTDAASVNIERLMPIQINLISVPTSCFNGNDGLAILNQLTGGEGGGDTTRYQYVWSIPNPSLTYASGLTNGQYFITVTDQQGCFATDFIEVESPRQLKPNLKATNAACFNQPSGGVTITSIDGNNSIAAYQWSNGRTTKDLSGIPAGVYSLTIEDVNGCTGSDTAVVTEPPPLSLRFEPSELRCSGDTTGFIAAFAGGGTPGYRFLWSNGRSGATVRGLGFGNYSVTLTDKNGCTLADTTVLVRPDSLGFRVTTNAPVCFGGSNGKITIAVTGGTSPYRYTINNGPPGGSSVFLQLKAGDYTVRVFDANGCLSSATVTVAQPLPIVVSLPLDTTLVPGDSLTLSADLSNTTGLVRYTWSSTLKDSITCLDLRECSEIQVFPLRSNTYRLTVADDKGCTGTGATKVTVQKPRGIFVPSGFSPNGDGQNDLLVVHGLSRQVQEILYFRVYDRWGELVWQDENFRVNDVSRGWDGRFRGLPCDPGVFVWTLEGVYLDGYREVLKGEVMLVR